MSAIPTMKMYKGAEVIVINAPDYDKYVDAGYSSKLAVKAEAPKVATPEAPKVTAPVNENKS